MHKPREHGIRSLNVPCISHSKNGSKNATNLQSMKLPNPYVIALLTATLAGLFAVTGGYFIAGFQAQHAVAQKHLEYRVNAYAVFLDKMDRSKSPAVSQILSIGAMAEHLATDGEIQTFEDRIAVLLKKNDAQDLYWQLNSDLNVLRIHGSAQVIAICEDLLKAMLMKDYEINWSSYPEDAKAFHNSWKDAQEHGRTYGWEEKITSDERLMVVTLAKLMNVLTRQLRDEVHGGGTIYRDLPR